MINIGFLAQLTSIIGWLLLVYSYYKDDIDKLLYVQIISSIFYCISYLLLGAYSGLIVCFIELIKGIGYYKTDNDNFIFWISFPVYLIMAIFTYDGLISLLPIIGSIIDGFSLTKNKNIATAGSLISNVLWVIYDVAILAFASAATDALLVISNACLLIFGYSRILKINKLRIVTGRNLSRIIYDTIYKLDKKNYGEEYTWSYNYEKALNEKNYDSHLLIKYHNEIVGYVSYYVITEEEYLRIINSDTVIKNYNIENITSYKKNKKNNLIIDSINIKHEYQDEISMNLIVKKIKSIIAKKYKADYIINSIISIAVNEYERLTLEKAHFKLYKSYSDKVNLYMIDSKMIEEIYLKNVRKKNDYKIIENENITENLLNQIKVLDQKFYKDEYMWDDIYQREVFNKNKKSIIMVLYKNKVIGYLNYLVITKNTYDNMITSNVITDTFNLDDIIELYKNKKNYITINSIVIEKSHQNGYAIKLLTRRLKRRLKEYNNKNYKIDAINAIAVSEDGQKVLENIGFEKNKHLDNESILYVLQKESLRKYLK